MSRGIDEMAAFPEVFRRQYLAELKAKGISTASVQTAAVVIVFIITVVVSLILYTVWT